MKLDRRSFLQAVGAAGAGAAFATLAGDGPGSAAAGEASVFPQGVAAGDPLPDGAVIWTRVGPGDGSGASGGSGASVGQLGQVGWEIARDDTFSDVLVNGIEAVSGDADGCVHATVDGLRPDHWYSYRFTCGGVTSRTGRLRTAPGPGQAADRLRFVFASCQQINDSHYVAHRAIAREGADFLLHLGDYVYVDDRSTLSRDDYRSVYRRFKENALLQDCHAQVPCVFMWDDGEFWNGVDAFHDPWQDEVDHAVRQQNGIDAAFDYLPVARRADDPNRLHRLVPWGSLADLFVLDVRSYRDPAVDEINSLRPGGKAVMDPERSTLGAEQKTWLRDGLGSSTASWRILGNPYNMLPWRLVDLDWPWLRSLNRRWQRNAGIYAPNEAWDDYQADRRELLQLLQDEGIDNVVSCAGHTHMYFAGHLHADIDDASSSPLAVEFVTGSLTADPDPRTYFGGLPRAAAESLIHLGERFCLGANPYWRYANFLDQGYAVVDVTPDELVCEYRLVDTFDPAAEARTGARFRVRAGSPRIEVLSP